MMAGRQKILTSKGKENHMINSINKLFAVSLATIVVAIPNLQPAQAGPAAVPVVVNFLFGLGVTIAGDHSRGGKLRQSLNSCLKNKSFKAGISCGYVAACDSPNQAYTVTKITRTGTDTGGYGVYRLEGRHHNACGSLDCAFSAATGHCNEVYYWGRGQTFAFEARR
jgi:hypothetical protein